MHILEIAFDSKTQHHLEAVEEVIVANGFSFAQEDSFDGVLAWLRVYHFGKHPLEELKHQLQRISSQLAFGWQVMDSNTWSCGWATERSMVWQSSRFTVRLDGAREPLDHREVITLDPSPEVFGDGQHASTILMVDAIEEMILSRNISSVLDFGSGSGILAIVAHKLGVARVAACEIDEVALEVAKGNAQVNACGHIGFFKTLPESDPYELVVCNIQPPLLTSLLPYLTKQLSQRGVLLLSGYSTLDKDSIAHTLRVLGFGQTKVWEKDGWLATGWQR